MYSVTLSVFALQLFCGYVFADYVYPGAYDIPELPVVYINASCNGTTHLKCNTTNFCIPLDWVCDGDNDCADITDEIGCDYLECRIYSKRFCKDRTMEVLIFEELVTQKECQWRCLQERFCHAYETRKLSPTGEVMEVFTHKLLGDSDCDFTSEVFTRLWSPSATPSTAPTTPPTTQPTTTPTTTPTTQPTTTVTFGPGAKEVAYSFIVVQPYSTSGGTVGPGVVSTDFNNHYSNSSNVLNVIAGGIFFVEMCAAVQGGQSANVRLKGSAPITVGVTWNAKVQNGVETQCRGTLVEVENGVSLSLVLDDGSVYSNDNNLIMMSVFSVSSSMSDDALSKLVLAVGAPNPPMGQNGTLTPLPMTTVIAPKDPNIFDAKKALYTCAWSGPHFVSVSVGGLAHSATAVEITNPVLPVALTRSSLMYDGITTVSRTTILMCNQGQQIQVNLLSGTVANSDDKHPYNLTTFTIFPYNPRNVPNPVAWASYKWYISFNTGPSDPFYYSNLTVNIGNAYNQGSNTITIPTAGYYYIHMSSGSGLGSPQGNVGKLFTMSLMRGTSVLFSIQHGSDNFDASDVYGHGGIYYCNVGDVLRVVGQPNSYFFSSLTGYQTSFSGMLLYVA